LKIVISCYKAAQMVLKRFIYTDFNPEGKQVYKLSN